LQSKLLIGTTVVFLVVILAGAILPAVLGGEEVHHVGVAGPGSAAIAERLAPMVTGDGGRIEVTPVDDAAAGERQVRDGGIEVLIIDGRELVVDREIDDRFGALVEGAHRQLAVEGALARAGVPPAAVAAALSPAPLPVRALQPRDDDVEQRRFLAFFGVVLLYVQLVLAGTMIANGVVEEKTSRVVELLLAKASPSQLLTGKLVGMGALSFAQLVLWVSVGLTAASLAGTIDLPPATLQSGALVLFWFALGYALYTSLFVVAGALAGRPEDLQNTTQIVTLVLLVAYGAAIATVVDPDGWIARVGTLFPITAPLVQPVRNAAGVAGGWEPLVGVVLVAVAIVFAVRVAARVYAGGALHFQGTLKIREALRRADQRGAPTE
jgi:ABC-2 type transport system permease protein